MTSALTENRIIPSLQATSKKEVLRELARLIIATSSACPSEEEVYAILLEREKIGSTGIGEGIAIPHGKLDTLDHIEICFGRSPAGIPFEAADDKPAHFFFLLLAPSKPTGLYLKTLAGIARFLKSPLTRTRLLNAENKEEILEIFASADNFA